MRKHIVYEGNYLQLRVIQNCYDAAEGRRLCPNANFRISGLQNYSTGYALARESDARSSVLLGTIVEG
jgi:hypothetical protein